jgi:cytoskeletal protein CcmA (bactofilin family)
MTIFNRNDPTPQGRPAMPDATPYSAEAKRPQSVSPTPVAGAMTSIISKALKITGQLESTENIQIDGEVEGDVRGVNVKVGQGAKVKGTVSGDGKIEAKKVLLTGTAHMSGDVVHQDIRIESGAFIDGHCRPESSKAKPAQATFKPVAIERSAS